MRGYVYILHTKGNHYYVGSTQDLGRRLHEHRVGKTKSLKNLVPFSLVFSQEYDDITTARKVEAMLKKFKSRRVIEKILSEGEIRMGR
jgi:putative endonuclease